MTTHSEWSYSAGLTVPAELVSTDPARIEDLVRRDLDGRRNPNMYRTAAADALNALNVMVTRRSGQPARRWDTVRTDTEAVTDEAGAKYNDITQTFSEGPFDECKEMARRDVGKWLSGWENSEFTHLGTIYNVNAEQERRLSVTQGRARSVGDNFTTSWYAQNGTKIDFLNLDTWQAFYADFHNHLEAGNTTFENAIQAIDDPQTTTTEQLDAILNGLPTIPGSAGARASGPLPGGQADQTASEPRTRSR